MSEVAGSESSALRSDWDAKGRHRWIIDVDCICTCKLFSLKKKHDLPHCIGHSFRHALEVYILHMFINYIQQHFCNLSQHSCICSSAWGRPTFVSKYRNPARVFWNNVLWWGFYRYDLNVLCTDSVYTLASLSFCHLLCCARVKLWGKQHVDNDCFSVGKMSENLI